MMSCIRFLHEEEKFLIDHYKNNKCLWKTSDENYYDKRKRNDVLRNLAEDDIKKKWKHLRATFGRELKKTLKNTPGTENGQIYRPKWVHFDDLQFLKDETAAELNLDSKIRKLTNSDMEDTLEVLKEGITFTPGSVQFRTSEDNKYVSPTILQVTNARVSNSSMKTSEQKDSIDDFLSHVGKSLRKLPELSIQRCILKIQNAIFEEFEAVGNS